MKRKMNIKKLTALILTLVLILPCVRLEGMAAESVVSSELERRSQSSEMGNQDLETADLAEVLEGEEESAAGTGSLESEEQGAAEEKTAEEETAGSEDEAFKKGENGEINESGEGSETSENEKQEEELPETPGDGSQEEQGIGTEDELPEDLNQGESETGTGTDTAESEEEGGTQQEISGDENTEESNADEETDASEIDGQEEMQPDILNDDNLEENQESEAQDVSEQTQEIAQSDDGVSLLDDITDEGVGFELQNGSMDITSGSVDAVLAEITFSEKPYGIDSSDFLNTLKVGITGAGGNTDSYFENLRLMEVNTGGETTSVQYQLIGNVKAGALLGTYTITMTFGSIRDTAAFIIVEKGIESLAIRGLPAIVSSGKKVVIKPLLEINGDLTGKDKTLLPKNKKMTWEIVAVDDTDLPSGVNINAQNGTVTINAGAAGKFRIKVTTKESKYIGADNNPVSFTSDTVEVVSDSDQRLESLVGCTIVLTDSEGHLLNQDGKTVDMAGLDGTKTYIKVRKADGSFVGAENYTLKANNKAFRIGSGGSAACVLTKPIRSGKSLKVKLTATLVNGKLTNGKKEQPLKGEITIQNSAPGEDDLSLRLGAPGAGVTELKDDGKTLEYSGSASTLIKIELMKNGQPVGSGASYNIKFKNLKKISEVISENSIIIYASLKKAEGSVILTDCCTGAVTNYEVKNLEKSNIKGKSPTIKQKTKPAPDAGPDYTITAKGKAVKYFTHVRVELLPADYNKSCINKKAVNKYRAFAGALGLDPYGNDSAFKIYEVGMEDNIFQLPYVKAQQPAKGSYRLQMTVGEMKDGHFEATAAPVIVTTKVNGNMTQPVKTPQEKASRIESVLRVTDRAEYEKVLPADKWTGKPESFTDVSPIYTRATSSSIVASGSLKKVEGFTGFSEETANQSGYYMLARIKLPSPETGSTYNAMSGSVRAINEKTFMYEDLTVEETGVYLDIIVKVAGIGASSASNVTLKLDYDGEGSIYKESTYTFDLSSVKLESDTDGARVLVAYFSATNTTEGVAKRLAGGINAELYEIVPEVPYTSADLNYNTDCRANREQNDPSARPAISGSVEDMEQYDIVFIGYPIWWGQAPKIIYTFMESYDFSGKTIVPFCTSGSSSIGSSATNMETLTKDAVWVPGRRFAGNVSESTLTEWVKGLNLNLGE